MNGMYRYSHSTSWISGLVFFSESTFCWRDLIEVELLAAQAGHRGRVVRDDQPDELVDVRLALAVVVRVLLAGDRDALVELVEDERAAADDALRGVAVRSITSFGMIQKSGAPIDASNGRVDVLQLELDRLLVRRGARRPPCRTSSSAARPS